MIVRHPESILCRLLLTIVLARSRRLQPLQGMVNIPTEDLAGTSTLLEIETDSAAGLRVHLVARDTEFPPIQTNQAPKEPISRPRHNPILRAATTMDLAMLRLLEQPHLAVLSEIGSTSLVTETPQLAIPEEPKMAPSTKMPQDSLQAAPSLSSSCTYAFLRALFFVLIALTSPFGNSPLFSLRFASMFLNMFFFSLSIQ